MNTKFLTVTVAALVAAAPMAFANGVTGGKITSIDPAAHTLALDGAVYSVASPIDLQNLTKGEQISVYVNDHAAPRTIERIVENQ
ncbi:hypothetical protein [Acidimangrovimonas pyrenivorans]|uniref:DUF1344 domain-containing protein n=1 Tax=Acidimangrovimonas pyrenivorans TaxID=2030798 RepID=A0ABV7AL68_9RHOB